MAAVTCAAREQDLVIRREPDPRDARRCRPEDCPVGGAHARPGLGMGDTAAQYPHKLDDLGIVAGSVSIRLTHDRSKRHGASADLPYLAGIESAGVLSVSCRRCRSGVGLGGGILVGD